MTIVNVEQAEAWDGHEGDHWAEHADRYDRASQRHWARFLAAGLVSEGDAVLDVGCGTGRSSRDVARVAVGGSVTGVDLSAAMLERARARAAAEALTNVAFVQGDAQVHPFGDGLLDLAISNFGSMFFGDPVAAFSNIGRGLRSGGGLALLVWRELGRNEWLTELRATLAMGRVLPEPPPDAPTPFSLADPDRVRRILGDAGFADVSFAPIDEPIDFGDDADDAFSFVRHIGIVEGLTHDLEAGQRAEALEAVHKLLATHETPEGVLLGTSAWLITARRS